MSGSQAGRQPAAPGSIPAPARRPDALSPWQVIGASVRGASHARSRRPNQDALFWRARHDTVFLAVADGHGSARYLRSHQGAKLAVHTAVEQLEQFLDGNHHPAELKRRAEEQLPRTLVRAWQDAVARKLEATPLSHAETCALEETLSAKEQRTLHDQPQRLFGATLLAAVVTPAFGLFLQLGDGDIITVDAQGTPARLPLVIDTRLFANETTSLAGSRAWQDMRVYYQPFLQSKPGLLLFATDGYSNSFQDEAGFLAAAADLHALRHTHGAPYIRRHLKHWLTQTSALGSGDDITVSLLFPG